MHVRPVRPVAGTVVVGVNELVGVHGGPHRYCWLRHCCEPIDHVAHAYLVFEVPADAVASEGEVACDAVGDGETARGQP